MKIKSFALLAMTGLLAVSCAYTAPAMADDNNNDGMQNGSSDQISAPSDMNSNLSPNNDNMGSANNNAGSDTTTGNNNNSDQASPDTATGDDDY